MGSLVTGIVFPTPCTIHHHSSSNTTVTCTSCGATCSRNSWWTAYPHYYRCAGLTNVWCSYKNSLPTATGGCANAALTAISCGGAYFGTKIKDCGPGYTSMVHCTQCVSRSAHGIASTSPGLFKSMTGNSAGSRYMTISVIT
jgi:hypothetical protein